MLLKTSVLSMAVVALMSCIAPEPPNLYEGCCGTEPVKFQLDKSLIFIPNLFTPASGALNDLFKPFFDEDKVMLLSMEVKSSSEGNPTLFTLSENDLTEPYWGWFGYNLQNELYEGKFLYEMKFKAKATGEEKIIAGSSCSAVCNGAEKLPIFDVETKCFFPIQYDKKEVFEESPLKYEIDCLKP